MKCKCDADYYHKEGYGTFYDTTILIPTIPIAYNCDKSRFKESISIDNCMVEEIKFLWSQNIHTTGCCCGHNLDIGGTICVLKEDIQKMKDLNYEQYVYEDDLNRDDTFIPKYKNYRKTYKRI